MRQASGLGATALAAALLASVLASGAAAQSVSIGTTKGGATAAVTATIAKIVSTKGGMRMRPQPFANTSQYIPVVNAGKVEFGASNIFQLYYAVKGTGMSEGRPNPNLRMVATLFAFRVAYFVPASSGIRTLADLKNGKRVPGFKKRALGTYLMHGMLAAANTDAKGIKLVRMANFPRMWAAFKRGQLDAAIAAAASRPTFDMKAARGALFIPPVPDDPAAVKRMQKWLPQSYVIRIKPNPKLPGLAKGATVLGFDYTLWAHKDVKADVVYRVAKTMHDNAADFRAASPLWRRFSAETMAKDLGVPYHPGAIRFYKEKGMWKR